MAKLNLAPLERDCIHAHAFGNAAVKYTRAAGITAAQNDTIHLMRLPAGTRLLDSKVSISAGGASTTANIGYLPVDGTAGNASYFNSGVSTATAAVHRANAVGAAVVLDRPCDVVVTATHASGLTNVDIDAVITYEFVGT